MKLRPNIIDRAISYVDPARGLARMKVRAQMQMAGQAVQYFDGAAKSRRTDGWRRINGDANAASLSSLSGLREACRDLIRNNGWAARGVQAIVSNTIASGIKPGIDAGDDKDTEETLEALIRKHFGRTSIDADGNLNLAGLQALATRAIVESGEVIIRRRARRSTDGYVLPFQLQVLEGDYIDSNKNGPVGGNVAIQGVEFDLRGKRVAYWLYDQHPGSSLGFRATSRRIPAGNVIHAFRVDRPGQVRGIPWMAPIILRLNDWNDFSDAELMRQKIAACYAGFRTTDEEPEQIAYDENGEDGYEVEQFEPGMIEKLSGGESITFSTPPQHEGLMDYSKVTLREIAAGLGITYEALTGDLQGVTFSAGRMGWLEFQRNIVAWREQMIIPQILHRIEDWFFDAATAVGQMPANDNAVEMTWTPPRREMIDPVKETAADNAEVRNGFASRRAKVRERGRNLEDVDRENQLDQKSADKAGLIYDSDARNTTQQGLPAEREDDAA